MSRAYRVRWATERRVVRSEDHLELDLDLMEILSEAEMQALLAEALADEGWTKTSEGGFKKVTDGVETVVNIPDGKVTLQSEEQTEVVRSARTKGQASKDVQVQADAAKKKLDERAAKRIFAAEGSVRSDLQSILQKVYESALQKKAASMGQVESVSRQENEQGQLELVIKVKV